MLPSLDPVQFSALFGVAVVQALAAVALFFFLQYGQVVKVYYACSLCLDLYHQVEVGVEVGVGVVEAAVEAWAMLVDKVEVGSGVGCNCIVGCYYNVDDVVGCYYNVDGIVGCYYNIDDDDDENVGLGVLALLMDEELPEVPQVVQVLPGELMDVGVVAVVALGLLEQVGLLLVLLALVELLRALVELLAWRAFVGVS